MSFFLHVWVVIWLNAHTHTQTHTAILWPFFQDHPGEPVPEEIFFWTFMVQGKITEADTLTIRLDTTLSGLINGPSPSSPIFMPVALPAATLPLYPGLGQAPNMLASILSGMVWVDITVTCSMETLFCSACLWLCMCGC